MSLSSIPEVTYQRAVTSSVKSTPNGSAGVSENQRDKNGHSKGDLSKLPNDVFTNISGDYLIRKEMAHFSCVSKEIESDLKQFAKRANTRLRKELEQEISQTEIVGIQISPGPFRNDIHKMSVLEMQNNNLGTAINVLEANNITNINDKEGGMTPLYRAARNGDEKVVAALIAAGANVNVSNKDEWTPLLWAASNGDATVLEALVIAGADITLHVLSRLLGTTAASTEGRKAIEEGKQKLISLYLSHVEKAAISPIHECESLTKTQKKQAKKYIEEREAAVAATTLQAMARGNQGRK